MKHYISIDGIHLLSETPTNIGFTKKDFDEGKLIELPENLVEQAEQIMFNPDMFDMLFPKKYYYIKSGKILCFDSELTANYNIGTTYNDYLNGFYVELNDNQIEFYLYHPNASISTIWLCGENATSIPTIDDIRSKKLADLVNYDTSNAVNQFIINGIGAWFTPTERAQYGSSISAAETMGVESLTFYIGDIALTVPTMLAKQMLAAVQLYADSCFIVTKQHEAQIKSLGAIDEIENYNFETGYPEKLVFSI